MKEQNNGFRLLTITVVLGALFSPVTQAIEVNTHTTDATDSKCSFTEALNMYANNSIGNGCVLGNKDEISFVKTLFPSFGKGSTGLELNELTALPVKITSNLNIVTPDNTYFDQQGILTLRVNSDSTPETKKVLFEVAQNNTLTINGISFDGSYLSNSKGVQGKQTALIELLAGANLNLKKSGAKGFGRFTNISDYTLSDNALIYALDANKAGTITISNSIFEKNQTAGKAVILGASASKIEIINSKFQSNNNRGGAVGSAGAIQIDEANVLVRDSQFIKNIGNEGGALRASGTNNTLTLVNSLFLSNYGRKNGGAIYSTVQTKAYSSSVLYNQSALNNGAGGVFVSSGKELNLFNSLLDYNSYKDASGNFKWKDCHATLAQTSSFSLIGSKADCATVSGVNLLSNGPEIYTKKDNKIVVWYVPAAGGNLHNKGDTNGCKDEKNVDIAKDVYGYERTANGRCDIGAAEVQGFDVSLKLIKPEYSFAWDTHPIESKEIFVEMKVVNNSAEQIDGANILFKVPKGLYLNGTEGDGTYNKLWYDLRLAPNETETIRLKFKTSNKGLNYDMAVTLYHTDSHYENSNPNKKINIKLKSAYKESAGGSGGGSSSSGGGAILWLLLLPALGLFRRIVSIYKTE